MDHLQDLLSSPDMMNSGLVLKLRQRGEGGEASDFHSSRPAYWKWRKMERVVLAGCRLWEANMQETRRGFVWDLATMAGMLVVWNGVALGQTPGKPTFPKPPTPGDPQEKNKTADASNLKAIKRAAMVRNEKEFRVGG